MRYRELKQILDENHLRKYCVCVGVLVMEVSREQILEAMEKNRGTDFRLTVEIGSCGFDDGTITLFDNDTRNIRVGNVKVEEVSKGTLSSIAWPMPRFSPREVK